MKTRKENSVLWIVVKIIKAMLIAWAVSFLVCMSAAAMLANGTIPEEMMDYVVLAALLLGAVAGGFMAVRKMEKGRLLLGLIFGTAFWLSLFCTGILLFDGLADGILVTALVTVCGSIVACLTKMPSGRKRNFGNRKYRISSLVQIAQAGK